MQYEEYEDSFVALLRMPGVEVSALPYVDALNDPRPAARPSVFLMYNGSTYADPEPLGMVAQMETLSFEVFIKAKSRRGKNGVFSVAGEVRGRLMGFRPASAITPVALTSFGYVAGIQNNWQYMLGFSFDRCAVQRAIGEPAPLIKQINAKSK